MKISVCIGSYNGEKYIAEQLNSIIKQLAEEDELIISDDSSSDRTIIIIKEFDDKRITLLENNLFRNPIYNFENAIKHATGDIIVLADQDDIWLDCKLDIVRKTFLNIPNKVCTIVMDNIVIDKNGKVTNDSLFKLLNSSKGILKNYYKNTYLGCNMAFSKELCPYILPFPSNIPMHDIWIGLIGELFGEVSFINKQTMLFRRHDNNATKKKYSIFQIAKWRLNLIYNLLLRYLIIKIRN